MSTADNTPDAIVIGSGPNGLAAAIELARNGASVRIVEAAEEIGGGTRSGELTLPGFVHDICSAVHPMGILSPFYRQLPLDEFGLDWVLPPASVAHPLDDGDAIMLYKSLERTAEGLGRDERNYIRLIKPLMHDVHGLLADAMAPLLLVDTNCPFRASVARQFESELTTSFPLPLSQYPRNAVVYSHKEASSGRLIVQLRYLPSVPGPHFGGTDEPAAFCELLLSPKQLRSITYNMRMQLRLYLSHALERYFAIRPDRYYLRFMDRDQTSQQDQMLLGKASISGTELMSQESIAFLDGGSRGGGGGGGGRREYPPSQIALPRDNEPVERMHRQDGLGLPGAW